MNETAVRCLCCGYKTIPKRGDFDICPICFWEDDTYFTPAMQPIQELFVEGEANIDLLLDLPSGANHGLTLRQGRANYQTFGACEREMLPHVRPYRRMSSRTLYPVIKRK